MPDNDNKPKAQPTIVTGVLTDDETPQTEVLNLEATLTPEVLENARKQAEENN